MSSRIVLASITRQCTWVFGGQPGQVCSLTQAWAMRMRPCLEIVRQDMYLALLQQAFGMVQPAVRQGICIFHKPL